MLTAMERMWSGKLSCCAKMPGIHIEREKDGIFLRRAWIKLEADKPKVRKAQLDTTCCPPDKVLEGKTKNRRGLRQGDRACVLYRGEVHHTPLKGMRLKGLWQGRGQIERFPEVSYKIKTKFSRKDDFLQKLEEM